MAKTIECRWGILGCGEEAAWFAAEVQAARTHLATTNSDGSLLSGKEESLIRHVIVAVSSSSVERSRAFADSHLSSSATISTSTSAAAAAASSSSHHYEVFGTSTELHAHPAIDSIFVASPQHTRYQEAVSALRGGKSVLLPKPLAIGSHEAKKLCEMVSRTDPVGTASSSNTQWLGFVMRPRQGEGKLSRAADECAKGRLKGKSQSLVFPWAETIAVLEALDEVREAGTIVLPSDDADDDEEEQEERMRNEDSQPPQTPAMAQLDYSFSYDVPAKRPTSRSSQMSEGVGRDEQMSTHGLRSQLHELRHVLRQKNALIASMEGKGGGPSSRPASSASVRPKAQGRMSLPPASVPTLSTPITSFRRRTSSLDQNRGTSSENNRGPTPSVPSGLPLYDVINTVDSAHYDSPKTVLMSGRRRRKDANGGRRSTSPAEGANGNSLGLSTVKETNGNSVTLGEGFLAPTIASENRRLATTSPRLGAMSAMNGLGSPILSPGGSSSKGSSRVIENLTNELDSARAALDSAKMQLRTSQRTIATLQHSLDEMKESLGRSRTENERLGQMMTRKERQIQEASERARKAVLESKELGKSSRDWGARVRKIEAELGEERILKQRAEVQYEAISTSWKAIREAWEREMKELRENRGDAVKRNREDAEKLLSKFTQAEQHWQERDAEGKILRGVIKDLQDERQKAAELVQGPVQELVKLLEKHEAHTGSQDDAVTEVQGELKRIMRLMRTPLASSSS